MLDKDEKEPVEGQLERGRELGLLPVPRPQEKRWGGAAITIAVESSGDAIDEVDGGGISAGTGELTERTAGAVLALVREPAVHVEPDASTDAHGGPEVPAVLVGERSSSSVGKGKEGARSAGNGPKTRKPRGRPAEEIVPSTKGVITGSAGPKRHTNRLEDELDSIRPRRRAGRPKGHKHGDIVGQYLDEIGEVPLLTADEEVNLSQIIERGREAQDRIDSVEGLGLPVDRRAVRAAARAKDRFIRSNLRLVVSIARRYPLPPSMELLDLIQEGNIGLEHAVDKFEWRKGFKFSTYATFWIRQSIGRALDQKASLIRLPGDRSAGLRAALRQVNGDGDDLEDEHARLHRLTTPTSLDRNFVDGDLSSGDLHDTLPDKSSGPESEVMRNAEEALVASLLDVLDPRAKYAVEQRFGLNDGRKRSYREVGEELGVTAEAARRLVKRSVDIVRNQAGDVTSDFDSF